MGIVVRILALARRWLWIVCVLLPWIAVRFPFYFVRALFDKRERLGDPNDQSPYAGQEAVAKRLEKIQAWQPGDPTAGEGDLKYRLEHWKAR